MSKEIFDDDFYAPDFKELEGCLIPEQRKVDETIAYLDVEEEDDEIR
jgi:hypothetical protein